MSLVWVSVESLSVRDVQMFIQWLFHPGKKGILGANTEYESIFGIKTEKFTDNEQNISCWQLQLKNFWHQYQPSEPIVSIPSAVRLW